MEMSDLFLFLLGIVVTLIGYFLKSLANDIKELEKNINACQNSLPHQYVLKEDYHRDIDEIKTMLANITEKLDKK